MIVIGVEYGRVVIKMTSPNGTIGYLCHSDKEARRIAGEIEAAATLVQHRPEATNITQIKESATIH